MKKSLKRHPRNFCFKVNCLVSFYLTKMSVAWYNFWRNQSVLRIKSHHLYGTFLRSCKMLYNWFISFCAGKKIAYSWLRASFSFYSDLPTVFILFVSGGVRVAAVIWGFGSGQVEFVIQSV